MKRNSDLAQGWLKKGDSDLADARRTSASDGPYDTACFHAQQAAEKYLKGLLAYHGQPIPYTHDLEELQSLCVSLVSGTGFRGLELEELSDYAVSARYDFEFWPDTAAAEAAVRLAETLRAHVVSSLPESARPRS
jgi:HEPN domain-containing protein